MLLRQSFQANGSNPSIAANWHGSLHDFCRAALLLTALLPLAVHSQGESACANSDQNCKVPAPQRHPVTTLDYWRESFAKPVEQRISVASPEVIDYVTQDNIKYDIPNRPRIPKLAPDFLRDLQQAFDELPAVIKRLLSSKLAGIMLAEDFGGTGYGEEIVDRASKSVGAFILLDSALLDGQTANAWATWKENTPFKPQSGYELVAEIEAESDDNRKNAIQYILIHELAHVLAIGENIHPSSLIKPKDLQATADFPYFSLTWTPPKEGDRYLTRFDAKFPERKNVVYYFGAKLAGNQMIDVYNSLEATNMPTLYGVINPHDDWAEAFVTYVHTVLMKKPFRIRLYTDGKLAKEYKACWTEERCDHKKKIIEQFLDPR